MLPYFLVTAVYVLSAISPLVSQVGRNFEYEYALIASWAILVLLPCAALLFPQEWVVRRKVFTSGFRVGEFFTILFVGPTIVLSVGAVAFYADICGCSPTGYFFWMALQWFPAWVVAHGTFYLVLRGRQRGNKRLTVTAGCVLTYALILALFAAQLWFSPQKRGFNLLAGFAHGPIYDAWIPVDSGSILMRVSHLFAGFFMLATAWLNRSFFSRLWVIISFAAWFAAASAASQYPSTGNGREALNTQLPKERKGNGFTLHYRSEKPGTSEQRIDRIFHEAAFHSEELRKILGGHETAHVDVYVYPNRTAKKLWFGGGATDVTDVVTPSIHIIAEDWSHSSLRHELVHALASEFGYKGLGFHPNIAFTEGLAVALAPLERSVSLDDGSAAILEAKRIANLDNLFSPYFWSESGHRAYTIAGSIIRFLIEKYGFDGVRESYAGKPWQEAFGSSRAEILAEWNKSISKGFDRDRYELHTEALFRHPGVLRSRCPHSKADLRIKRAGNPYVRLRQPIDWDPKRDYWKWRQSLDPSDQSSKLVAWRKEIRELVQSSGEKTAEIAQWQEKLAKERSTPPKIIEDVELALIASDLYALTGEDTDSRNILDDLAVFAESHYLGDALLRKIQARIAVADLTHPGPRKQLRQYLAGWGAKLTPKDLVNEPWITTYLRLRRRTKHPLTPSEMELVAAREMPEHLPATFLLEWKRFLALRYMDLGIFDKAAMSWSQAADMAPRSKQAALKQNARLARSYLE